MLSQKALLPEKVPCMHSNPFKDTYVVEFLELPDGFKENDLRKALVKSMRNFILELGRILLLLEKNIRFRLVMRITG